MPEKFTYEGWCVLELFGHQRLGGKLTLVELGNSQLLRVDVHVHCAKEYATLDGRRLCHEHQEPAPHDHVVASPFHGVGAIYRLTPCSEAAARAVAGQGIPEPVHTWELPQIDNRHSRAWAGPLSQNDTCPNCREADLNLDDNGSGFVLLCPNCGLKVPEVPA